MTVPSVTSLPLDLTGLSSTNYITNEPHTLPNTDSAVFVLNYGPFFTENLTIRMLPSGTILTSDQYKPIQLFIDATMETGKPICSLISINDPSVTGLSYEVDYHAIGGTYSESVTALEAMIQALQIDNRTVLWGDIVGKPELYAPTPHLHDLGDIYGFEYIVTALERIRNAIIEGDSGTIDSIYQYINEQIAGLGDSGQNAEVELQTHINNTSNPHNTTATQVGLGNVQNYGIANSTDAVNGLSDTFYMTPLKVSQAITSQVGNGLNSHIANVNNPHNTTAAQVGLGNVANNPFATIAEANNGSGNNYMSASLVAQAITYQVGNTLAMHVNNTGNPHSTNAAQVGLGNVQNYGIANSTEAMTGASDILYMTPLKVSQAIASQAGNGLNSHIANVNNPHNTTAAQVGLGNVQNFGIANSTEATSGLSDTSYMTPLKVSQAITAQVGNGLNSHIANTGNPHSTTATQVGLGNVQNFGIATNAVAVAGTATNAYMTPSNTNAVIKNLIDLIFPIGSYHLTENTNSPQVNFSWQTWTQVSGRVLVGYDSAQTEFSTVGGIGGEKTHVLSINEMPSHNHNLPNDSGGTNYGLVPTSLPNAYVTPGSIDTGQAGIEPNVAVPPKVMANTGGGAGHNNLQPYKVVYMWKRTN